MRTVILAALLGCALAIPTPDGGYGGGASGGSIVAVNFADDDIQSYARGNAGLGGGANIITIGTAGLGGGANILGGRTIGLGDRTVGFARGNANFGGGRPSVVCGEHEVENGFGGCEEAEVISNIFVFKGKDVANPPAPLPLLPKRKKVVNYSYLIVPQGPEQLAPVVMPAPEIENHLVVLSKAPEVPEHTIIQQPSPNVEAPRVTFVHYDEREDLKLPGGINLQDALSVGGQGGVKPYGSQTISVGVPSQSYSAPASDSY